MTKNRPKSSASKDDDICELCAGTGSLLQMHSPRRGQPDLNAHRCPACGGTGRKKKAKPQR